MPRPILTLAHSPDPDDAFMWWPITGKIAPFPPEQGVIIPRDRRDGLDLAGFPRVEAPPAIATGRFEYRAFPADISLLNAHAARAPSSAAFDVTALSFRAYADVKDRYAITACGSSFGEGFGPKVVAGRARISGVEDLRRPGTRVAIPGRRTTAFMVLGMMLGRDAIEDESRFVEMPCERIIPAVSRGEVEAGLVIHEGQVLFEQAGLSLVADVGAWWGARTGLPLPLGANAVRRGFEDEHGSGTLREIARTLRRSIEHALAHRRESIEYTVPFALANTMRSAHGGTGARIDQIDRYVAMYVNRWTVDMGEAGREAVVRLLREGHALGLAPDPGEVDVVPCAE